MDYVEMLKQFHVKYNHDMLDRPGIPESHITELRYKLIDEEVNEELLPLLRTHLFVDDEDSAVEEEEIEHLVELADALADSLYVIFGTAITYGIPIDEVFAEVHHSNMTKSGEKNEYGKSIKGKDFELPKIREILERHINGPVLD